MCRAVSEVRSWRGGGVARDVEGSVLEQPNALAKTSKYSNARRESSRALRTGQVSCAVCGLTAHATKSQWVLSL